MTCHWLLVCLTAARDGLHCYTHSAKTLSHTTTLYSLTVYMAGRRTVLGTVVFHRDWCASAKLNSSCVMWRCAHKNAL